MEYDKCECGGKIVETKITYYRKFNKKLYIFEDVPVGVCQECGERIFKGYVLEKLEKISNNPACIKNEIKVPVCSYT
jgi:YgiT-type zinc finger domain-containing protein